MIPSRRSFLIGATASLVTAPAIVRAASLMPVRAIEPAFLIPDVFLVSLFKVLIDNPCMTATQAIETVSEDSPWTPSVTYRLGDTIFQDCR